LRRTGLSSVLLLSAFAAIAFQGCAGLSKTPHTAPPVKPPVAAKPPVAVKPPAIPVPDRMFADGMAALQEGGHERALELFSAAWMEKPGHAGVAREFDGALLALKKNGDAAYSQGKWEDAGKRWMGALRFITHPAANWRDYPFTRSEVRAKVDRLSAALTEKALTEYRRGEVPSAIAGWKTILSYDPGHEEAARSLRTATQQLETLKKMPPGK
jgi:thioredoxin-like negative regulator of GroEL